MSEVRAKKALGQHFLTDLNIAHKICDALSSGPCRCGTASFPADSPVAEAVAVPADFPVRADSPASADASVRGTSFVSEHVPGPLSPEIPVVPAAVPVPAVPSAASLHSVPAAGPCASTAAAPAFGVDGEPCDVLEVGCGMGVLTQFLLERSDITLWGAEIDAESVAYLHAHFPGFTPRLMEGDFLKMDLRVLFPRGVRVIGNFPYNISSQIFFKVLENRDLIPECVGMIQREVAVRLAEPPGSREYGILSVLLQAWYDIDYLFTVGEKVFNPPPKVKSAVIRLRRNGIERLGCDETLFVRVVKAAFGQRRKMIRNALRAAFGDFRGAEHPFFSRRAEQLSVADFVSLTNWVAEHRG